MLALISAVLVSSLLGSLHCAGMCGGLLALASAPGRSSRQPFWLLPALYNLGRLVTYALLGAIAGALGGMADWGTQLVGFQRGAAVIAGITLITLGMWRLAVALGWFPRQTPVPESVRRFVVSCHARTFRYGPAARAGAIGLLTPLLPCGWLYAFVATSAAAGSAAMGALAMSIFWLGTLPALLALGAGISSAFGPLQRHLPYASAILLFTVGSLSIAGKIIPAPHCPDPGCGPGGGAPRVVSTIPKP